MVAPRRLRARELARWRVACVMALGTCQIYTIRAIMSAAAVSMEVSRRIKRHVLKKAACHNGNADGDMPPRIMARRRRPSHVRRRSVLDHGDRSPRRAMRHRRCCPTNKGALRLDRAKPAKAPCSPPSSGATSRRCAMLFGPAIVRRVGRAKTDKGTRIS